MCIFCGGSCGGSGDMLMPLLAASAVVAVAKVRDARKVRKMKEADKTEDRETEVEFASEHSQVDA